MTGANETGAQVLEIRTYKLVPGARDEFDRVFRDGVLRLLERYGIDVAVFGPSLDADDHYFLMRAFPSQAQREKQLQSFYGSDEWRDGHRAAVLALIETYHTVVLPLTASLRGALGEVARA